LYGDEDQLNKAVEDACAVWADGASIPSDVPLPMIDEPNAVSRLTNTFGRWDRQSFPVASGLLWSLYWLGQDHLAISAYADDFADDLGWLRVPVVHYVPRDGTAGVGFIQIARLLQSRRSQLVTHPESGLVVVDQVLDQTLTTAWTNGYPRSAVWRLVTQGAVEHFGESLELAARVGFQALGQEHPHFRSDCVLIGRIRGTRLEPVTHIYDKLRAAARNGLRAALVADDDRAPVTDAFRAELGLLGMDDVRVAGSLMQATEFATGSAIGAIGVAGKLLLGRYRLEKRAAATEELWSATQVEGVLHKRAPECLVRLYSYATNGAGIEDFQRSAWARDLRTLNRLANCPGAADSLLTLRQASKDVDNQCFVLVLESSSGGVAPLASYLTPAARGRTPWLAQTRRRDLWRGLRRLAEGVAVLHSEHILHRHLSAETIFCTASGPDTFRLGGIENSLRVASIGHRPEARRSNWCRPPESEQDGADAVYGNPTDWYSFGMVAARLLLPLEDLATLTPEQLHAAVDARTANPKEPLSSLEREFVRRLIARDVTKRIEVSGAVLSWIDEIQRHDDGGAVADGAKRPLGAVLSTKPADLQDLATCAKRFGNFLADPQRPHLGFDQALREHRVALRDWIQQDLRNGFLFMFYARWQGARTSRYGIQGATGTVVYYLTPQERGSRQEWDFANIAPRQTTPGNLRDELCVPLSQFKINVYLPEIDLRAGLPRNHRNWREILPRERELSDDEKEWLTFQQFLRVTNQIELLMLRDEIFPYSRLADAYTRDQNGERLILADVKRDRSAWSATRSMLDFFHGEIESGRGSGQVHLLADSPFEDCDDEPWDVEFDRDKLILRRTEPGNLPPLRGFVRASDYQGKIRLIERRQDAIERLGHYGYLMRALLDPRDVWMNTSAAVDMDAVFGGREEKEKYHDKPERLQEILQSIPIYALEGPPGTGKSTLTAFLVRALLVDDPGVQILITAQAHGAVDVLRQRVDEVLASLNLQGGQRPIAVRLGQKAPDGTVDQGALHDTARVHLEGALQSFKEREPASKAAAVWLGMLTDLFDMSRADPSKRLEAHQYSRSAEDVERSLTNYRELLRGAANIIYTTTSARDLEYLARTRPTFDWVIIEEAGKAHGFDLALPMQAGHRWVLLGDSRQLKPHRYKDFLKALGSLDAVATDLTELREGNSSLIDSAWLNWWESLPDAERERFTREKAPTWLATFEYISKRLSAVQDGSGRKPWGRLRTQFRMHPLIGDLIRDVFYPGELVNATECSAIRHQVQMRGLPAAQFKDTAIVWVDCVWSAKPFRPEFAENGRVPYANSIEEDAVARLISGLQPVGRDVRQTVAVLSPYSRQVRLLQKRLGSQTAKPGIQFKQSHARVRQHGREIRAHTVDSFQGNEADVVVISLVRNNGEPAPRGLGFISDPSRLNVLSSRAAKLLVLVGSWDFFDDQTRDLALPEVAEIQKFVKVLKQYREEGKLLFVPTGATSAR
jgi:serine/threonine protein kinase